MVEAVTEEEVKKVPGRVNDREARGGWVLRNRQKFCVAGKQPRQRSGEV